MTKRHGSDEGDELDDDGVVDGAATVKNKKRRTRDGCLTCRQSKKGCDKTKPQCMRCKRLNYVCEWPEIKTYSQIGAARRAARASSSNSNGKDCSSSPATAVREEQQQQHQHQQEQGQKQEQQLVNDWTMQSNLVASRPQQPSVTVPALDFSASLPVSTVPSTATSSSGTFEPPVYPSNIQSPPSNALDSQFWQDNSLYTFDYNFHDFTDIDALLKLVGLPAPSSQIPESTAVNGEVSTSINTSNHIVIPKDKLKMFSKLFPPRVVALLQRMIAEQENSTQVKLPLAYIVSVCLWTPSSAVQGLLQAAKDAYSGPGMESMLKDLGEVAWTFLSKVSSEPAKHPKIAFPPEQIASMDISLPSKLFALMDIAFRQAVVEGASAYYKVVSVMEELMLKNFRPGHLFNVAELARVETVYLYNFVLVDIFRAIQLGTPTTFAYHYTPSAGSPQGDSLAVGNSDAILCIMSEISALRFLLDRDVNSRTADGLNPMYQPKADEIIRKIEANPAVRLDDEIVDLEEGLDSIQAVATMASQEAWRQAALVYYYQSLYRDSPKFNHASQASCQQILKLFPISQMGRPHRLFAIYGLPCFLAATVASTPEDRQACMKAFNTLSVSCVTDKQIVTFFEHIWAESDKLGRTVDWLDYVSAELGPLYL